MLTNYHTHTQRCNHAVGSEEEYVLAAIEAGYRTIGFSDHMPLPKEDKEARNRMRPEELDEYVAEVLRLKDVYHEQIKVYLSFEFDVFPNRIDWVKSIKDKYPLDYLIFGNHYYNKVGMFSYYGRGYNKKKVLADYYSSAKFTIETNLFDVMAHPDLYMESYPDWDEHAAMLAHQICQLANKHNVILEYNLSGLNGKRKYPCHQFWEIVAAEKCKAIIGVDAHNPKQFSNNNHLNAKKYLNNLGIEVVTDLIV